MKTCVSVPLVAATLAFTVRAARGAGPGGDAPVAVTPVAVSGQSIPGSDARFFRFHLSPPPQIDNAGNVALLAELTGSPARTALVGGRPGSLGLIARPGDAVPGTDLRFGTLFAPRMGDGGEVVVFAGNDLFLWRPDALLHVARDGATVGAPQPAPPFTTTVAFKRFLPDNEGRLSIEVLSAGRPGAVREVARGGARAPGPQGAVFDGGFSAAPPGSSGAVAFRGRVLLPSSGPQTAIWAGPPDQLRMAVATGVAAPAAGGLVFASLGDPQVNAAGDVAFQSGPSIWVAGADGSLARAAGLLDPAPGTDGLFAAEFHAPTLNDAGQVAFRSRFQRPGESLSSDGIWAGRAGALRLVVHEGQPAPGAGDGVAFDQLLSWDPMFNARGQVAFGALLAGPGVTSDNDLALYATGLDGTLHLVAREGMSIDLPDGTARTIATLTFPTGSSGQHSRSQSFNDAGQLVFSAGFANGSAVFIAAVPEPATGALVLLGAAAVARRHRATPQRRR